MMILLLCDDLIFTSRIGGTAKALGLSFRAAKTMPELQQILMQSPPRCVIVDLQAPDLALADLVRAAAALPSRPTLVGYGSHVDTATLKAARDAGLDVVWPRSKFVDELAAALPEWVHSAESAS
jgi:CheY-like chemotaxis protein